MHFLNLQINSLNLYLHIQFLSNCKYIHHILLNYLLYTMQLLIYLLLMIHPKHYLLLYLSLLLKGSLHFLHIFFEHLNFLKTLNLHLFLYLLFLVDLLLKLMLFLYLYFLLHQIMSLVVILNRILHQNLFHIFH